MNAEKKTQGALNKFSSRYGSFFSKPPTVETTPVPAITKKLPAPPVAQPKPKPAPEKPKDPIPQEAPTPVAKIAPPNEADNAKPRGLSSRAGFQAEWLQGCRAARDEHKILNQRWPEAFPFKAASIRPLNHTVLPAVIEATGWRPLYAKAVLHVWKTNGAYCRAILKHTTRIHIDGSPTENTVDENARQQALLRLEALRKRNAERAEDLRKAQADQTAPPTQTPQSGGPSHAEPTQAKDKDQDHGAQDD